MAHVTREERDNLILDNLRLVTRIAADYRAAARARRLPWDDLIQEGRLGLCRAAENSVKSPTRTFGSYARERCEAIQMRA